MNGTGLRVALLLGLAVGLLFGFFPQLDLKIASLFVGSKPLAFAARFDPAFMYLREYMMWIVGAIAAPAFVSIALKLMQPDRPPLIPGRAAVFLIITLALGPGLVANVVLKEHWGRPRPIDVTQFGGDEHFVAWWNPHGDCAKNCSFVSGDVAGAMWTIGPAALTPLPWRPLAYAGAIGLTVVVALLRMAFGGHFVTDVFFAGFFTFLIAWGVYALIYRWPASPLTEERINAMLERLAAPGKAMRARWREQIVQAMRNRDANEQG